MPKDSKLLLVNPPNVFAEDGLSAIAIPPIGLAYLAAAVREAGFWVEILDGVGAFADQHYKKRWGGVDCWVNGVRTEELLEKIDPDITVVGITCMFMHRWPLVREIVLALHQSYPEISIILGGEHASACAETIVRELPFVVVLRGEGEATLVEWMNAHASGDDCPEIDGLTYAKGRDICSTAPRKRIKDLGGISRPAWDLVPIEEYMKRRMFHGPTVGKTMPVLATRGCPFQCTFCTSPGMWTTRWTPRAAVDVVDEIAGYYEKYGARDFQFVDLTAILKKSWLVDFSRELILRGFLDITWQMPSGTRSEVLDAEVAGLLAESGCRMLVLAPESGSKSLLARIKKRVDLAHMMRAIRELRKANIQVDCNFIIGIPGETFLQVAETWWFMIRLAFLGVETIAYSGFRPAPGSELAQELASSRNLKFDDHVCMSLLASTSLLRAVSWNDRFFAWQISLMRMIGIALFFGVSFTLRPWRVLRLIVNIARNRQENRLERIWLEFRQRRAGRRAMAGNTEAMERIGS